MKLLFITLMGIIGFTTAPTENVNKTIDPEASVITWKGYKVLGSHTGTLQVKEGNLEFEGDQLQGGSFVIDMASLATTDLEGEAAGKLVGHLSSPDFFAVEQFPTASFKITKVVSRGKAGDYKITGDLTIKETTKSTTFNALIEDGVATAKLQIDRSEYDIRYGSGSFFDNLGDNTIYDEFDLEVQLALKK